MGTGDSTSGLGCQSTSLDWPSVPTSLDGSTWPPELTCTDGLIWPPEPISLHGSSLLPEPIRLDALTWSQSQTSRWVDKQSEPGSLDGLG